MSQAGGDRSGKSFEELKRIIHSKLVDKLDLSRVSDLAGDTLRREIRLVVERLCDTENPLLNRMERERLIDEVLDEAMTVHEAMAELPENCRDILDRFFAQDESYRTIGEALDLPPGTIASRISRCLEKLKALLEETGGPARPETR